MTFPYSRLGRYRVLYVEPNHRVWASQGYDIFVSEDMGQTFQLRATCPASFSRRCLSRWRPAARGLRAGILSLLPLPDENLLVVVRGRILHYDSSSERFVPVLERPGRTMKVTGTSDGLVYAGEYFYNAEREPVHIYVSRDQGRTWSVAYTFPARSIRHVHAITNDPLRQGLLVLTGDLDHESKVLFTSDGFKTLQVLTGGGQGSRAVGIVPMANGFYLPTDTPFEQNYVQFLSKDGSLERRCPIAGSCLATCQVGDWAFFGTAVEPSPVNRDSCAALYGTSDGVEWRVIARWPVDMWSGPTRIQAVLFQMARVVLPSGENRTGYLFATTIGVRGADGILHRWEVA
jgi:hypothetical protein